MFQFSTIILNNRVVMQPISLLAWVVWPRIQEFVDIEGEITLESEEAAEP